MDLFDFEDKRKLSREEAATWLTELAHELSRNNQLQFRQNGIKHTLRVPAEVEMEVEIEIEGDGTSIEIELSW